MLKSGLLEKHLVSRKKNKDVPLSEALEKSLMEFFTRLGYKEATLTLTMLFKDDLQKTISTSFIKTKGRKHLLTSCWRHTRGSENLLKPTNLT